MLGGAPGSVLRRPSQVGRGEETFRPYQSSILCYPSKGWRRVQAKGTSNGRGGGGSRPARSSGPVATRRTAVALLALALGSIPLTAGAARAQGPVDVEIDVGYEGRFVPGRWLPVTVLVESSQAVAGELEVAYEFRDGNDSLHSMAIEVPGGGRKQFDFLVPAPPGETRISASFISDDEVLGGAALTPVRLGAATLAGVLGEAPPPSMDSLTLEPSLSALVAAPLTPERLNLGSGALETLSYVVANRDALEALAPAQRDALMDWVVAGGRVLLTADDPESVAWPEQAAQIRWQGRSATGDHSYMDGRIGGVDVGLGEIMVTSGNLSTTPRSVWGAALRPAPVGYSSDSEDFFNDFGISAEGELFNALRGNSDNLQLGWFVGFLAVYLVLVGPVNYFLLKRRGRKELLWVTIPFLALAFSGVAYGLARGSRGGTLVRTAGIVFADAAGQKGRALATVSSGTGGTRRFSFNTRAAVAPNFLSFFGNTQEASTQLTPSGVDVFLETAAFSVHVVRGAIEEFDGYVEATALPGKDGLGFEVTNRTPYELTEAMVLYGRAGIELDDLGPGDSTTLTADPDEFRAGRFRSPVGGGLKRALIGELRAMLGPSAFSVPLVIAVIEDYELDISLEGRPTGRAGRFVVASPVDVEAPGSDESTTAGRVNIVSVDGNVAQYSPGNITLEGFQQAVFSYQLPAGLDPARIAGGEIRFAANAARQDMLVYDWRSEQWEKLTEIGRRGTTTTASLPEDVFSASGEVYFRLNPNRHGYAEIYRFEVEPEVR